MLKKDFIIQWDEVRENNFSEYSYKRDKNAMYFTKVVDSYVQRATFVLFPVYDELRLSEKGLEVIPFTTFMRTVLAGTYFQSIQPTFSAGRAILPDIQYSNILTYKTSSDVEHVYKGVMAHLQRFEDWFVKRYSNFHVMADVVKNLAYLEKYKFEHPSVPFEQRTKHIVISDRAPVSSFHKLTVLYLGEQYEAYEAFKEGMRAHFARFGDIVPEKAHEVGPRLHALAQLTAGLEGDEHKETIAMLRALRYSEE